MGQNKSKAGQSSAANSAVKLTLMVIASDKTVELVSAACTQVHIPMKRAHTMKEVIASFDSDPSICVVVAALGTMDEPDTLLFDAGGDRSSLIIDAKRRGIPVIVFSFTACRSEQFTLNCFDAGAAAVVNSTEMLVNELAVLDYQRTALRRQKSVEDRQLKQLQQQQPADAAGKAAAAAASDAKHDVDEDDDEDNQVEFEPIATSPKHSLAAASVQEASSSSPAAASSSSSSSASPMEVDSPAPPVPVDNRPWTIEEYPSLAHRFAVAESITQVLDSDPEYPKLLARVQKRTANFTRMVQPLLDDLMLPRCYYTHDEAGYLPSNKVVRFVVISDTHHMHKNLNVPAGEVLLHCGDMVGNYGDHCDLRGHILSLAKWLNKLPFQRICLIPGNHDTELDVEKYPKNKAILAEFLAALKPHISLLIHKGITYRGINIFGSPYLTDRLEEQKTRYYSNAFETHSSVRRQIWETLPEGLDILMTHAPPVGDSGDVLLAERLSNMKQPPLVHCVGHAHRSIGMELHPFGKVKEVLVRDVSSEQQLLRRRLLINAAQEKPLTEEPGCGGTPWVFDLLARDVVVAAAAKK